MSKMMENDLRTSHFYQGKLVAEHKPIEDFVIVARSEDLDEKLAWEMFANLVQPKEDITETEIPESTQLSKLWNGDYLLSFFVKSTYPNRGIFYPEYHCIVLPKRYWESTNGNLEALLNSFENVSHQEQFSQKKILEKLSLKALESRSQELDATDLKQDFAIPVEIMVGILPVLLRNQAVMVLNAPDLARKISFVQDILILLPPAYRSLISFDTWTKDSKAGASLIFAPSGYYPKDKSLSFFDYQSQRLEGIKTSKVRPLYAQFLLESWKTGNLAQEIWRFEKDYINRIPAYNQFITSHQLEMAAGLFLLSKQIENFETRAQSLLLTVLNLQEAEVLLILGEDSIYERLYKQKVKLIVDDALSDTVLDAILRLANLEVDYLSKPYFTWVARLLAMLVSQNASLMRKFVSNGLEWILWSIDFVLSSEVKSEHKILFCCDLFGQVIATNQLSSANTDLFINAIGNADSSLLGSIFDKLRLWKTSPAWGKFVIAASISLYVRLEASARLTLLNSLLDVLLIETTIEHISLQELEAIFSAEFDLISPLSQMNTSISKSLIMYIFAMSANSEPLSQWLARFLANNIQSKPQLLGTIFDNSLEDAIGLCEILLLDESIHLIVKQEFISLLIDRVGQSYSQKPDLIDRLFSIKTLAHEQYFPAFEKTRKMRVAPEFWIKISIRLLQAGSSAQDIVSKWLSTDLNLAIYQKLGESDSQFIRTLNIPLSFLSSEPKIERVREFFNDLLIALASGRPVSNISNAPYPKEIKIDKNLQMLFQKDAGSANVSTLCIALITADKLEFAQKGNLLEIVLLNALENNTKQVYVDDLVSVLATYMDQLIPLMRDIREKSAYSLFWIKINMLLFLKTTKEEQASELALWLQKDLLVKEALSVLSLDDITKLKKHCEHLKGQNAENLNTVLLIYLHETKPSISKDWRYWLELSLGLSLLILIPTVFFANFVQEPWDYLPLVVMSIIGIFPALLTYFLLSQWLDQLRWLESLLQKSRTILPMLLFVELCFAAVLIVLLYLKIGCIGWQSPLSLLSCF